MELEDRVALVTGAGQGLGKEIARVLSEVGAVAAVADIKEENAILVADDLTRQGMEAIALKLDVSDETSVQEVVDAVLDKYGKIDILINNAGTDVTKKVTELQVKEWDRVLGVNLRGPFLLSKAIFPIMKGNGGGHIVNMCSTASLRAWDSASAYHASKWGLRALSHALYVEGRESKIKVTAIVAGGMRTPFILDRFPDVPLDKLQDPKNVAETIKFVLTRPEESIVPEVMIIPLFESSWP